jgi:hypothetical protein
MQLFEVLFKLFQSLSVQVVLNEGLNSFSALGTSVFPEVEHFANKMYMEYTEVLVAHVVENRSKQLSEENVFVVQSIFRKKMVANVFITSQLKPER